MDGTEDFLVIISQSEFANLSITKCNKFAIKMYLISNVTNVTLTLFTDEFRYFLQLTTAQSFNFYNFEAILKKLFILNSL